MNDQDKKYTDTSIRMICDAQISAPRKYNPDNYWGNNIRVIEEQTSEFLEYYAENGMTYGDKLDKYIEKMLKACTRSHYTKIQKYLGAAQYRYDTIKLQKEIENTRALKEKKLRESNFSILDNSKAMSALSSDAYLFIADTLDKTEGISKSRLLNKLHSHAQSKIEKTLRGEIKADNNFKKLVQSLGNYKNQKKYLLKHNLSECTDKRPHTLTVIYREKKSLMDRITKFKKSFHNFRNRIVPSKYKLKRTVKIAFTTIGMALLGYCGYKVLKDNQNSRYNNVTITTRSNPENVSKNSTPNIDAKIDSAKTAVIENDSIKTANFTKESLALQKAYKNRFDTSLEILLGAPKRDKLYHKIDSLAQNGRIEYQHGTTREWYAHAFTMYKKVQPYSEESLVIDKLFRGENVDKTYLNSMVIKAKRNGSGVRGTTSYSSFDHSSEFLKEQHLKSRKNVKEALRAKMNSGNDLNY